MTGALNIQYPEAIKVRHVDGASGGELFLNYCNPGFSIMIGNSGHNINSNGSQYSGNAASSTRAEQDSEGRNIFNTYSTKEEVDDLKKSVSDGKESVAAAVTAKGVTTAADATFATIAANIGKISTGVDTSDANAGAADILTGKTAYVNGVKVAGKMVDNGAVVYSGLNAGGTYTILEGYHNGQGKVFGTSLGTQTPGTADASSMLSGKTAWVNGKKVTGEIPVAPTHPNENSGIDLHFYGNETSGKDHNIFMMVPNGYYNNTWLGYKDVNLIPENIKKGVTIGGGRKITGTYEGESDIVEKIEKKYTVDDNNPIISEKMSNIFSNPILKYLTSNDAGYYILSCITVFFNAKSVYGSGYSGSDIWAFLVFPQNTSLITTRTLPNNFNSSYPWSELVNVNASMVTQSNFIFRTTLPSTFRSNPIDLSNYTYQIANLTANNRTGSYIVKSTFSIREKRITKK